MRIDSTKRARDSDSVGTGVSLFQIIMKLDPDYRVTSNDTTPRIIRQAHHHHHHTRKTCRPQTFSRQISPGSRSSDTIWYVCPRSLRSPQRLNQAQAIEHFRLKEYNAAKQIFIELVQDGSTPVIWTAFSYYMLAGFEPLSTGNIYLDHARRMGALLQDEATRITFFQEIVRMSGIRPSGMTDL